MLLGLYSFFCHIFAPSTVPYLDGRWTRKQHDKEMSLASRTFAKMKRYATAFAVTDTIGILLELISLIPVLKIQYISMLCQVALKAFVFSINYSYLAIVMPMALWEISLMCFNNRSNLQCTSVPFT